MLVLKGLVGLHRTVQLQLLHVSGWGIDLDYHDIERFALETNRDHSVIFEIASKYCIWGSFVDYDGYSISSKAFLPTVVGATPHQRSGVATESARLGQRRSGGEELSHISPR